MGCAKSTENNREQPIRKHNKPPLMGDKNHELKVEHANRSDSQALLNNVIHGIRPKFEEKDSNKQSIERRKKVKDPAKRYRRVLIRVEHHKNDSNSSYSSLCSDWQTINSEDERLRSCSNINQEDHLNVAKNEHVHENPFEVKEESKDDSSKLDDKSKDSIKRHKHSKDKSDDS